MSPTYNQSELRPVSDVMKLARMGSAHPTRLSFMRTLLRRIKQNCWEFDRVIFNLDNEGVGIATYKIKSAKNTYTLVAFSHKLDESKRSDRVIANEWDATFTMVDGDVTESDIERLQRNVPYQEAGRVSEKEFVLSRANRSVRLFNYVIDCLSQGAQPDPAQIEPIGYLMRTTAVYGSGKFGAADRAVWADREEFRGSFQPEMLCVWLIRTFAADLVEHLAKQVNSDAVKLEPHIRRMLGIGNSTGLGMAPFLVNHPALLNAWIETKEKALSRVRTQPEAKSPEIELFMNRLQRTTEHVQQWQSEHPIQQQKLLELKNDLHTLKKFLVDFSWQQPQPWNELYQWSESILGLEGQELLVSLILEPHGSLIDDLADEMWADESKTYRIDGTVPIKSLKKQFADTYDWTDDIDFESQEALARVWYVSAQKLEPRLGERFEEPIEPYEQPLCPGRDAVYAMQALEDWDDSRSTAEFLLAHPEHRLSVRRVQQLQSLPYGEIRDNTIGASMLPIDMLRCKLAFFGARKFDPRSDRWVRITMFQGAPYPDELHRLDPDHLAYPESQ